MNLQDKKGKTIKIDVDRGGDIFHYTAKIIESDGKSVTFVDKFGKEIIVPIDRIVYAEVIDY
jgi:hypothetical protein